MATEGGVLGVIRASRPTFRNSHDKVAYAIHASFLAAGYSLIATGSQASAPAELLAGNEEVGIEGWNDMEDAYAFCYIKTEKEERKSVVVKGLVMGDKLIVDAAPMEDSNVKGHPASYNLEINVNDYTNDDAGTSNYGQQYKNLSTLVGKVNSFILSKLEESSKAESIPASSSSETVVGRGLEVDQNQPRTSTTPEHEPYSSRLVYPPVPPIGGNDLLPGPGAGIYPSRGGVGIGGGMLLGPNDPRWGIGIDGQRDPFSGGIPGIPSGARFDPFGPPGVPGFEPNRFIRGQRPPGGGTHPDLEHFSPF